MQPANKKEIETVAIAGNNLTYLQKAFHNLFGNFLPCILTPIYKTCKVENYFNLKSNIPALLLSNVVYRFSCPCDAGLTYISKSTRHLLTRPKL